MITSKCTKRKVTMADSEVAIRTTTEDRERTEAITTKEATETIGIERVIKDTDRIRLLLVRKTRKAKFNKKEVKDRSSKPQEEEEATSKEEDTEEEVDIQEESTEEATEEETEKVKAILITEISMFH